MTRKIEVKAGERFGRLTVVSEAKQYRSPGGQFYRRFLCKCECGSSSRVRLTSLRSGLTASCGCLQRDNAASIGRNNSTHGMDGTPTHKAWLSMRQRCLNHNHPYYDYYGGRGISICQQWLDSFSAFLADMGIRPDNRSLDRINNDGNYEPGNCRWATQAEQNRNMRRTRLLTLHGETLCLSEWSRRTGISRCAIGGRLRAGLSAEQALTIPPGIRRLKDHAKTTT